MEDRVNNLERNHSKLLDSLNALAVSVTQLSGSMKAHVESEEKHEQTLRNIDNNLNKLTIEVTKVPINMNEMINKKVEPLWKLARDTKDDLADYKREQINTCDVVQHTLEERLKNWAKSHVKLLWAGIVIIGILSAYIHNYQIDDLKSDIEEIKTEDRKYHKHKVIP